MSGKVPPQTQQQWLKSCFSAWKQTDAAYSKLARSRNLSLNMVWVFECLSEHPEGMEPAVLAEETNMLRQAMTVVLNDLEKQGLVTREFHPTDRRKKVIRLTPKGGEICRDVLDAIAQSELEALSELCEEDQRLLFELTTRFCHALVGRLTKGGTAKSDAERRIETFGSAAESFSGVKISKKRGKRLAFLHER